MASDVRLAMGQMDFSSGVDSGRNPLIVSAANPNGLKPDQLAWANNCTTRDGVLTHRPGLEYLATMPLVGLYQSGYVYEPHVAEFPYLYLRIAGRSFTVKVDVTPAVITEITIPGDPNSPTIEQGWAVQGEEFLVDQENAKLPLFYDGVTLRRSRGPSTVLGLISTTAAVPAVGASVLVTLTAPFTGANGDTVYVNGQRFTASTVATGNWINLRNDSNGSAGAIVPAGATINDAPAGPLRTSTAAPFTIPAIGADTPVAVSPAYPAATPEVVGVTNNIGDFTVLNTTAPVAGANQIFLVNVAAVPGDPISLGDNIESDGELPAGQAMDYYMGRIWIANGRQYLAGDIVGGPSGSAAYGLRDSILKMTENAFTVSGGAFTVPTNAGNIRALKHPANLDTALGEGQLMPFTRRNIYSTNVSPTRAEWATLSEPIQRVAQINFGTTSDRSVAQVNGDLYYRSIDGVRSFTQALRYFNNGPGNTPISHEMTRLFDQDDKSMLRFCSSVEFDNRLLTLASPYQTPCGVAFRGIGVLNFDLLSSINEKLPPAWEGCWEGLSILQLLRGDFGGRMRCFAIVYSELEQNLQIWELSTNAQQDRISDAQIDPNIPDSEHSRIVWSAEFPAWDFGKPFELKTLDCLQIAIDRLSSLVEFQVDYRPGNSYPCWIRWHNWSECAARNNCELPNPLLPCTHIEQTYLPQYRAMMTLPIPPVICNDNVNRPSNIDFSFQVRITVRGSCRIRSVMMYAIPTQRSPFDGLRCTS